MSTRTRFEKEAKDNLEMAWPIGTEMQTSFDTKEIPCSRIFLLADSVVVVHFFISFIVTSTKAIMTLYLFTSFFSCAMVFLRVRKHQAQVQDSLNQEQTFYVSR